MTSEAHVNVRINRAGAKAIGTYQAGKDYDVDRTEAKRLIKAKGFVATNAAVQKELMAEIKADEKQAAIGKVKAEKQPVSKTQQEGES